jgi:uncharacterized protein (UPF0333 family)
MRQNVSYSLHPFTAIMKLQNGYIAFLIARSKGGVSMKKFIAIAVVLLLAISTVTVFAAGGKNHGEVGKGTVSNGSSAQGNASQPRTGR